jgi:hypothetical protein
MADGLEIDEYSWRSDDRVVGYGQPLQFLRTAGRIGPTYNFTSWNIATIPTILSARRLIANSPMYTLGVGYNNLYAKRAKSVNARWTTHTSQPVVMVRCLGWKRGSKNVYYVQEDDSQSLLPDAANLYDSHLSNSANKTHDQVPPLWMSSPDKSKSLLALFIDAGNDKRLIVCTIDSFWHRTSTSLVPFEFGTMIQTTLPESKEAIFKSGMTKVVLDPEFMSSLGLPCNNGGGDGRYLSLCFANALSWIPGFHHIEGATDPSFEFEAAGGHNGSELNDSVEPTLFEVVETIDGYGYGATDISIRLSVAVMVTYCMITILYVSYIITTGHTSIAWDCATELIMLALQSKEPTGLGHISVGLDSMETFRKGVGIRVSTLNDDVTGQLTEKLELVFEDDEETKKRGLTKIERGQAY